MTSREISAQKKVKMYQSWLTNENLVMVIYEFAQKQNDSKEIRSLLKIINKLIIDTNKIEFLCTSCSSQSIHKS